MAVPEPLLADFKRPSERPPPRGPALPGLRAQGLALDTLSSA